MTAITRCGLTLAAVAALVAPLVLTGSASAAAPSEISCAGPHPDDHDSSVSGRALSGSSIYAGISINCPVLGKAAPTDQLDYRCSEFNGYNWYTYLRDENTGVEGWVRRNTLTDFGSNVAC
ncbi:SH3 domain-containing protein [Streptomyces sp. 8N114]|uniref:SH3 domain-containing protein n=1 Tax=Streptomyces sp. 8N114 TaxID=3457419 RepID=UPI003FD53C29